MPPKKINQNRLVRIFKDVKIQKSEEIRFCFLLGSGASISSDIPTGGELAKKWLKEIKSDLDNDEFIEWKKSKKIIEKRIAEFYPQVYEKRFDTCPQAGYEVFKKLMENKEPSIGYVILSQILVKEKHNFVITTNFDYLIEDAVRMYTGTKPFSAGHETLASFISSQTDRPTIIKVHRDLFLHPFNDEIQTDTLKIEWKKALKPIMQYFNLLAIGYGGNDGSLMDYLKEIKPSERKSIYWCKRTNDVLNAKINKLLTDKDYLVEIEDFDKLMYALHDSLGYNLFDNLDIPEKHQIVLNAIKRVGNLNTRLIGLLEQKEISVDESKNLHSLFKGVNDYIFKVNQESNPIEKENILKEGLKTYPNNVELLSRYADFLSKDKEQYNKAKKIYNKLIARKDVTATVLNNAGVFYINVFNEYERAKELYEKAINIEPSGTIYTNYAILNKRVFYDLKIAEQCLEKAIKPEYMNTTSLILYADFQAYINNNFSEAETYYKLALDSEPNNSSVLYHWGLYQTDFLKDYKEGFKNLKKAIEITPNNYIIKIGMAHCMILKEKSISNAKKHLNDAMKMKFIDNYSKQKIWFYRYAFMKYYFNKALLELNKMKDNGIKTIGWRYFAHIGLAQELGHSNVKKLKNIARDITNH